VANQNLEKLPAGCETVGQGVSRSKKNKRAKEGMGRKERTNRGARRQLQTGVALAKVFIRVRPRGRGRTRGKEEAPTAKFVQCGSNAARVIRGKVVDAFGKGLVVT